MDDKMQAQITEHEELLLMKFFDGQCSFLERGKAQRLIEQSSSAAQFFTTLQASSRLTQDALKAQPKVDLWDAVSRRIESEEHAALFLGKRESQRERSFSERCVEFFSSRWSLGLSGAAVAASVALFLVAPFKSGTANTSEQMVELVRGVSYDAPSTQAGSASVQPVGVHGRPRILNEQAPNVVEVDWMRSDGRLRMLHEPTESSAIIWVRRRNPAAQVKQNRYRQPMLLQQATPFGIPVPVK
ncbi:MAG: hypothetical protein J0M12_13715 [Deltaproteobacteria bacterium]|nr:hypothetical protein [Deltaproteobacteria bacterium]